jgi:large-conductance mechanosensitive channel
MFKALTQTKLPPIINKVVVVIGLCGMFIGLLLSVKNQYDLGLSVFYAACLGFLFAGGAKYIVVKFMRAWIEGKLEQAAREREEARKKAELLKAEERAEERKRGIG